MVNFARGPQEGGGIWANMDTKLLVKGQSDVSDNTAQASEQSSSAVPCSTRKALAMGTCNRIPRGAGARRWDLQFHPQQCHRIGELGAVECGAVGRRRHLRHWQHHQRAQREHHLREHGGVGKCASIASIYVGGKHALTVRVTCPGWRRHILDGDRQTQVQDHARKLVALG